MGKRANIARTRRASETSAHLAQRAEIVRRAGLTPDQRAEADAELSVLEYRSARWKLTSALVSVGVPVALIVAIVTSTLPVFYVGLCVIAAGIVWIYRRPSP